jgi:hypothetical protein
VTCPHCRRDFGPSTHTKSYWWKRFCSAACRVKFHNDRRESGRKAVMVEKTAGLTPTQQATTATILRELGR